MTPRDIWRAQHPIVRAIWTVALTLLVIVIILSGYVR